MGTYTQAEQMMDARRRMSTAPRTVLDRILLDDDLQQSAQFHAATRAALETAMRAGDDAAAVNALLDGIVMLTMECRNAQEALLAEKMKANAPVVLVGSSLDDLKLNAKRERAQAVDGGEFVIVPRTEIPKPEPG